MRVSGEHTSSEQISALLGTLASAGPAAYPPAAPVLPLLDSLGQALLSAGTDGVEFRFSFVLDPSTCYQGLSYPRVEAGSYVFVREHNRKADTPRERLAVDENTGRVRCREALDSCDRGALSKEYRYDWLTGVFTRFLMGAAVRCSWHAGAARFTPTSALNRMTAFSAMLWRVTSVIVRPTYGSLVPDAADYRAASI